MLSAGTRVAGHEILSVLGQGASAVVYRARAPSGRDVALKLRDRGQAAPDRRFMREYESLRRLRTPGLVQVFDAGVEPTWLWFSMEIVRGVSLRRWIQSGPDLDARVQRACAVGTQVARTLRHLHPRGFVHRDLKPSNVLVSDDGQVHVLDLGVAQWFAVYEDLTATGGIVGTPSFMAPETIGGLPVDGAADVFALGLMLWEGLAGRRPGPSRPAGWLSKQCLERLEPLVCVDPRLPRGLSSAVERCLRFDPATRPTAGELVDLLQGIADGAPPADWPEPPVFLGRDPEIRLLDQALQGQGPRTVVVAGDPGSGRRRLTEQCRRRATLRGIRNVRARCRVDEPGGAVRAWLAELLSRPVSSARRGRLVQDRASTLLRMWPDLPLHALAPVGGDATRSELVSAAVETLLQVAEDAELLLVLDGLEDVDAVTYRVLRGLAERATPRLTVLLLLDARHPNQRALNLMLRMQEAGDSARIDLQPLPPLVLQEIGQSLSPTHVQTPVRSGPPLHGTQLGLRSLAASRGEAFHALDHRAGWLSVAQGPLPRDVVEAWVGPVDELVALGFLVAGPDDTVEVPQGSFRTAAVRELQDPARALDALANAWEREGRLETRWLRIAPARLASVDLERAWEACVRATRAAERTGHFGVARAWLLLLDTLKLSRDSATYQRYRFELAWCRARVSAHTDTERPRGDLVDQAATRALTRDDNARVVLLEAQLLLRQGRPQQARELATRSARMHREQLPDIAAQLLALAAQAELELERPAQAERSCDRARDLPTRDPLLECEQRAIEAAVQLARGVHAGLEAKCLHTVTTARSHNHVRAEARVLHTLAQHLLQTGQRRTSEDVARQALALSTQHVDHHGVAAGQVELALQAAGRGEPAAAARWMEHATARVNKLHLHSLRPRLAVARLQLATVQQDPDGAALARDEVGGRGTLHWHLSLLIEARSAGDMARAEALAETLPTTGHAGTLAQLELARARLNNGGEPEGPLRVGLHQARALGLPELEGYGRLMLGVLQPTFDPAFDAVVTACLGAAWAELFLGALEFDGRRRLALGDPAGAERRLRVLLLRSEDLGHVPYQRVAGQLLSRLRRGEG